MLIFYRFEPDDAYKKNAYKKKTCSFFHTPSLEEGGGLKIVIWATAVAVQYYRRDRDVASTS